LDLKSCVLIYFGHVFLSGTLVDVVTDDIVVVVIIIQWRIQGGANPAMASPSNLAMEFGPPLPK
jgi:hypothetical protein